MINLKGLIDLLPIYYKENDTYKVNGKGVLERFLEICGNYFQDNIKEDIDNILDIIDIENTKEPFINFIWEFLGSIPYANITDMDSSGLWNLYRNTELNRNTWISSKVIDPKKMDLIKYAIPLYKIRGTPLFYEVLFRFYYASITFDSIEGGDIGPTTDVPLYDSGLFYDQEDTYDLSMNCTSCIRTGVTIENLTGGDNPVWTQEPSDNYINSLILVLNRFKPINMEKFELGKNVTVNWHLNV